jgi:hypothetical protein
VALARQAGWDACQFDTAADLLGHPAWLSFCKNVKTQCFGGFSVLGAPCGNNNVAYNYLTLGEQQP